MADKGASYRMPFKIALAYAFLAALWILFSDMLAGAFFRDLENLVVFQMIKGLLFVSVTSILLYFLVGRFASGQIRDKAEILRNIEAIRDAEEKYSTIFSEARDGIVLLDAQTGFIVDCNAAFERLTGRSRAEMRTMKVWEMRPAEKIEATKEKFLEIVEKGGGESAELDIQRPDGGIVPVEFMAKKVRILGKDCILSVSRDITERRKADEAFTESERRYRNALENMMEECQIISFDWRYLFVNDAAAKHGRGSKKELLGRTMMEAYPGIENTDMFAVLKQCMEKRVSSFLENEFSYPGGGTAWFELSIQPVPEGLFILSLDITERKKYEEAVKESKTKFFTIFHKIATPVALSKDGVLTDVNEAWEKLFGYSKQESMGKTSLELRINPDAEGRVRIAADVKKQGFSHNLELRLFNKSGEAIDVISNVDLITLGGQDYFLSTVTDITERKKAEEEIARAKKDWERTFDAVIDPIMILDTEYRIERVNKSMAEKLGVPVGKAVGLTCYEHVHNKNEPPAGCPHKKLLNDGLPHTTEILEDRIGGYYLVNVSPIYDEKGVLAGSVHSARDISGLKRAEESLRKSNRALRTLSRCNESLVHAETEEGLLNEICNIIVNEGGYRLAWVGYADNGIDKSVRPMAHAGFDSEYIENLGITWADTEKGRGPTGTAIRTGNTSICRNILEEAVFSPWREEAVKRGYASSISMPLKDDSTSFGALNVYSAEPDSFDAGEVSLLEELSKDLAYGIRSIRTRKKKEDAEEATANHLKRMEAMHSIDMAISGSLDIRVVMNVIVDQVVNNLRADAGSIMRLNPHSNVLEHIAAQGMRTVDYKSCAHHLGESASGHAALDRKPVLIPDMSEAPEDLKCHMFDEEGFGSAFFLPLVAKGQVKGVIAVYYRRTFNPDRKWLDFLEIIGGQAAIAIDNAALFDDIQKSHSELFLAYEKTIEGWARALDYRDKETEGHSRRVTEITMRMARAMGINDAELVHVKRGALLHDIGKLGIPDGILLKPGKLTAEEWEIIKTHPVIAYKLLSPIAFLRPAIDIPYYHHEKWNGTGYPRGLKEEDIPLPARIFSVVDVWDALRSDRPYRPAWDIEKTREYIKSLAGVEFDPDVVEVFLKIERESASDEQR